MNEHEITEDQIEDIFEEEVEETPEIIEDVIKKDEDEQVEEPQLSALEQEAVDSGWTNKEDFVSKGGDPERHKSAHEYIEYGKITNALNKTKADQDRMEAVFNKRLDGVNKIHKAQEASQLQAFKDEQRQAVEDADTDAYDAAQVKIDSMEKETTTDDEDTLPPKDPLILEWEAKNSWVNNKDDPRSGEAADLWNSYIRRNPGESVTNALAYVDKAMDLKPERQVNLRRETPSDTTRQTTNTKVKSSLSFNDLSRDEQDFYNQTKHDLWADEKHPNGNLKDYLKAVKDSRTGQ